jgi:nicotinate-nucleotide adenylyltransferase
LTAGQALGLERVVVLPSGSPPHRHQQPLASRFHRFAMAALAITGEAMLEMSDLEIGETGPSYTFDTLARLHRSGVSASQIFFITGADAFAEIETWSRYPQVLELANFIVVSRAGRAATSLTAVLPALAHRMRPAESGAASTPAPSAQLAIFLLDAQTPDVSSTEIRRRLLSGDSICGLVPKTVETYIRQHGLYTRADAATRTGQPLA